MFGGRGLAVMYPPRGSPCHKQKKYQSISHQCSSLFLLHFGHRLVYCTTNSTLATSPEAKKRVFGGASINEAVGLLYHDLLHWYPSTRCLSRIQGKLTAQRLKDNSQLELMWQFCGGSDSDREVLMINPYLRRFYEIISSTERFFSDSVKAVVTELGRNLANFYASQAT